MTILITGDARFIGTNFIFYIRNKYPDFRIVKADITDRKAVYTHFEEGLKKTIDWYLNN